MLRLGNPHKEWNMTHPRGPSAMRAIVEHDPDLKKIPELRNIPQIIIGILL